MLLSYAAQAREAQAVLVVGDRRWSDLSLRSANKTRASTAGQIRGAARRSRRRQETNLVMGSWSAMPADEASKDIRYRLRSAGSADRCRLPVLRFLGNESAGMGRSCPLSSSLVLLSVPESRTGISHAALGGLASRVQTYGCLGGRHVSEAYL